MAKKKPSDGQGTFESLRSMKAIPAGYYSGDQAQPESSQFRRTEIHALRPGERRLRRPGLQPADRDDQGDGDLQHARLLVEEAARGHPAVYPPLHEAGRHRARPILWLGRNGLSALLDGRKAIAIDRSPAATFITKNHCTPVDPGRTSFRRFRSVKRAVQQEIDWLYETRCDRCGGKAMTGYTVYSQVFQCPRCLSKIPLYDCGDGEPRPPQAKPRA